jgi:hypothetical protein
MAPSAATVYPAGITWTEEGGGPVTVDPATIRPAGGGIALSKGVLDIDFGREMAGSVEMTVKGAAGLSIDMRFAETVRYLNDTALNDFEKASAKTMTFVWLPEYHSRIFTGDEAWKDPQSVGGFRYVRIVIGGGTGALSDFSLAAGMARTTPDAMDGFFLSNDDQLNRIWYSGLYTLDICTIPTGNGTTTGDTAIGRGPVSIVDGGKRDRLIWLADLYISALVDYSARKDHQPTLDSFSYLLPLQDDRGRFPASSLVGFQQFQAYDFLEYTPFGIMLAAEMFRLGGDKDLLSSRWKAIQKAIGSLKSQMDEGLISIGTGSNAGWAWSVNRSGKSSYINMLYVKALREAAYMAAVLGQSASYSSDADILSAAINSTLWDDQKGAYIESDEDRTRVPLDANMMAILAGVASEKEQRIWDYIWKNHDGPYGLLNVDVPYEKTASNVPFHNRRPNGFINFLAGQALFESGQPDKALELAKKAFGFMAESEPGTMWEFSGTDGKPEMSFVSMAHAWSAGATALLSRYVLGVRPTDGGYSKFVVDPQPGPLTAVHGAVPAPGKTPIRIRHTVTSTRLITVLKVPEGTAAEIRIPDGYSTVKDLATGKHAVTTGDPLILESGEHCVEYGK